MSDPVLEKRDNHCFISYASEDGALAQRIANWLGEAGLRIWFDQVRLGAGAPVLDVLTRYRKESRAGYARRAPAAISRIIAWIQMPSLAA